MCPERTIEGNALAEICNLPQIVGGVDEISGQVSKAFFENFVSEIILVESSEAAELIKLANNTYRDLTFAFANELTKVAMEFRIGGRNLIRAANLNYPRSQIPLPGPSGGPCLTKDPWILVQSAVSRGVTADLARISREINEAIVSVHLDKHLDKCLSGLKASILGLAFKGQPLTTDTRGSFVFEVCRELRQRGCEQILGYEPAGQDFPDNLTLNEVDNLEEALVDVSILVILTNAEKFYGLEKLVNNLTRANCMILDFWGVIDKALLREDIQIRSWG
jgi:nucleotide sugar dehydrogenase